MVYFRLSSLQYGIYTVHGSIRFEPYKKRKTLVRFLLNCIPLYICLFSSIRTIETETRTNTRIKRRERDGIQISNAMRTFIECLKQSSLQSVDSTVVNSVWIIWGAFLVSSLYLSQFSISQRFETICIENFKIEICQLEAMKIFVDNNRDFNTHTYSHLYKKTLQFSRACFHLSSSYSSI